MGPGCEAVGGLHGRAVVGRRQVPGGRPGHARTLARQCPCRAWCSARVHPRALPAPTAPHHSHPTLRHTDHGHGGACAHGAGAVQDLHHGRGEERAHGRRRVHRRAAVRWLPGRERAGCLAGRCCRCLAPPQAGAPCRPSPPQPPAAILPTHPPASHARPWRRQEIHRVEEQIKRRVAIGSFVSERKLVDELVRCAACRGANATRREGHTKPCTRARRVSFAVRMPAHALHPLLPCLPTRCPCAAWGSTKTWCARASCSCRPLETWSTGGSAAWCTA